METPRELFQSLFFSFFFRNSLALIFYVSKHITRVKANMCKDFKIMSKDFSLKQNSRDENVKWLSDLNRDRDSSPFQEP